jgi:alkanesulfonate monooxygenase SsuD/methylene tetrahydromethanopterin reductase-like flavin-dependent oxidoreductase (luciferase family)
MARLLEVAETRSEAEEIARQGARWTVSSHHKKGLRAIKTGSALNQRMFSAPNITGDGSVDPIERYLDGVVVYGTPDEVVDEIQRLEGEMYLGYLLCAPLSHSSFELFTDKVLPRLI